jgi:adenine phosphoribosyltransferase
MNSQIDLQTISNLVEVIPNFPEDGVYFRNIGPLLANNEARTVTFDMMYDLIKDLHIDCVAGIESRGFIFGTALAERLKCDFVMIRKPGNVPDPIIVEYGLEYRKKSALCIQPGIVKQGKNVLIVDDILATGGSALATCELIIDKAKANVIGILCFAELYGLQKQERQIVDQFTGQILKTYKLGDFNNVSLLKYSASESSKYISRHDQLFRAKKVNYFPLEHPFMIDNRVIVFSPPTMKSIANGIVSKSMNYRSGAIHWNYFPDGFPNIKFEHMKFLENKKTVFILDLQNKHLLLEQLSMMMVLADQFVESLDIIVPYFAPGTMERVEEEGTLATAETTARLVSMCLPMTKKGRVTLRIFDLHTQQNRFYFPKEKVAIKMESAIDLLKSRIPQTTTIVFPDDGAHKRFRTQFENYKIIVCSKVREEGDKRSVTIKDRLNIPNDDKTYLDDVLIVDDLVQTGGTLEECRKALVNFGAKKVSCYVTHAVFPKMAYKKFVGGSFDKFYITNSVPEISSRLENIAPFEVIRLEDEIIRSLDYSFQFIDRRDEIVHLNVYVASTNQTKMTSVYIAIKDFVKEHLNVKVHIFGIGVPSEIPEQPVGTQTNIGCANRLSNLQEYVEYYKLPYDLLVSIENGIDIDESNGQSFDFSVVKLKSNHGEVFTQSDHKTYFPIEFYKLSLEQCQTVTVGNLIEKKLNIKSGTWHERYGSKTRECDLKETMFNALQDESLQLI